MISSTQIILELNAEEAAWIRSAVRETFDLSKDKHKVDIIRKIYQATDPNTENPTLILNDHEAEWLKSIVQNPTCHPDEETPEDGELRRKFWNAIPSRTEYPSKALTNHDLLRLVDDDTPF